MTSCKYPRRESNPRYCRERAASWASRRRGRAVSCPSPKLGIWLNHAGFRCSRLEPVFQEEGLVIGKDAGTQLFGTETQVETERGGTKGHLPAAMLEGMPGPIRENGLQPRSASAGEHE